jgi:hypothetical protein
MTSSPASRMPRRDRIAAALAAAALATAGGPLGAEPLQWGAQAALAFPQADLNGGHWLHGNTGVGCGLHVLWPWDGGHAFRLRADAAWLPRNPVVLRDAPVDRESAKVRLLSAGVDYNFFPGIHPEGLYLIAGLGYSRIRCYGVTVASAGPWPGSQEASAPVMAMGLGSRFTPHLGGELRLASATFKNLGRSGSRVGAPMFTAALTLDF